MNTLHVSLTQNTEDEKQVKEIERIKHGSGIKGRDDNDRYLGLLYNGIEILMFQVFAKIKPKDPSN